MKRGKVGQGKLSPSISPSSLPLHFHPWQCASGTKQRGVGELSKGHPSLSCDGKGTDTHLSSSLSPPFRKKMMSNGHSPKLNQAPEDSFSSSLEFLVQVH